MSNCFECADQTASGYCSLAAGEKIGRCRYFKKKPRNLAKPEHVGGKAGDERSVCTQLVEVAPNIK